MGVLTPKPARTADLGMTQDISFLFVAAPTAANLEQQLVAYQQDVIVDTNATYTTLLKLPPVAEAAGKIFTVVLRTDGGQNVTISPFDNGSVEDDLLFTDVTLDDAGDKWVGYSNGLYWFTLASGATTT